MIRRLSTMAPRCNQSVFCCASATHDLLTAAASVSDIVFDVLVTIQFYRDHLVVFCTVSIIIFAIAQAAYAFLFTSSYASHLKPSQRVLVFLAVLPIAQLIPVFAWIESLHWPGLQRLMIWLNLKPSNDVLRGHGDSVWLVFRAKFASHSGFLAEAVLEAVPQCALQTAYIMWMQEVQLVPLISILLSVLVIVTKGWVVSFSLHRPTLALNIMCTAGDIFGLFAIVCWTFSKVDGHPDLIMQYLTAPEFLRTAIGVFVTAFAVAAMALVAIGLLILVFVLLEDTLCNRRRNRPPTPLFDRFIVAPLAWALAQIPLVALLGTIRLSLLPLVVFRSLDSEHAVHASFYRPLFEYLAHGKSETPSRDRRTSAEADVELYPASDALRIWCVRDADHAQACSRGNMHTASATHARSTATSAVYSSERTTSRAERLTSLDPPGLRRTETSAEDYCELPVRSAPNAFPQSLVSRQQTRASASSSYTRQEETPHPSGINSDSMEPEPAEAIVLTAHTSGSALSQREAEVSPVHDQFATITSSTDGHEHAYRQAQREAVSRRSRRAHRKHEGEQLRTLAVNTFLSCARRDVHSLQLQLQGIRSRQAQRQAAVNWARTIGLPKSARFHMVYAAGRLTDAEAGIGSCDADQASRGGGNMSVTVPGLPSSIPTENATPWYGGLGITIPWLLRHFPGLSRSPEPLASPCSSGPVDALLQLGAVACVFAALPLLLLFAAAIIVFIPLGVVLPIISPAVYLGQREPLPILASVLSGFYLAVIVIGLCLVPSVRSFQVMRIQLCGAASFPTAFYCKDVVDVIADRCEAAVETALAYSRRARAPPLLRFGCECSICMVQIRSGQRVRELNICGHSFHEDCILRWIHTTPDTPRCPNCRQLVELDDPEASMPLPATT